MPVDIMEDIMRICSTDKKCNLNVLFFHWISINQPEVNLTEVDKFIIVITKYTYLIFKNLLFSKHKKYLQYVCSPFKFCVGWCSTSKHLPSKYRSNHAAERLLPSSAELVTLAWTKWLAFCRQHFTNKCIFLTENLWISTHVSLKFVPEGLL